MKHTITFFAVLMMALAVPQSVKAYDFSAVAPSGQTLYYNIEDGAAQVTSQTGYPSCYSTFPTGALSIPDSVTHPNNGTTYAVTSIGNYAFYGCTGLTSVTIPNSVTSIGNYAFYYCSGLTSVTIPNLVTSIGVNAFRNCTGLTSVAFNADSCTSAGNTYDNRPFYGCSNITTFTFGDNVTIIPAYLCCVLSGLTSVTIPNSVTTIGGHVFEGCSGLTSVTIPNSVTSIGQHAFLNCNGITSIVVEAGNSIYDSRNNCNAIVRTVDNQLIHGCTTTIIPNTVTSIGDYAFYNCSGLTSVTIPNLVTSIGVNAFKNCTGLTSVTIPNSVTSIGAWAFYDCTGLTSVTIGSSVTAIGQSAFSGCSGLLNLISRATYPPSCGSNVFDNVPAYCTLTVPCGSQIYYSVTSPWNTVFQIMNEDCRDEYTVTVISDNPLMGYASANGVETLTVLDGDAVTITATGNPGYHFLRWNDDNTDSVRTVIVTADITYTAYFEANVGIADVAVVDGIMVYVRDNEIVVCAEGMEVMVYDVMGHQYAPVGTYSSVSRGAAASSPNLGEQLRIAVPASGVYLVKVGNHPARKVVVVR